MSAITYYEDNPNDFYDFIIHQDNNSKSRTKTLKIKRLETKTIGENEMEERFESPKFALNKIDLT